MYKRLAQVGLVTAAAWKPTIGWSAVVSGAAAWVTHIVFGFEIAPFVMGGIGGYAVFAYKGEYFHTRFRQMGMIFIYVISTFVGGVVAPWISVVIERSYPLFNNDYLLYSMAFILSVAWPFLLLTIIRFFPQIKEYLPFLRRKD